MEQWKDIPGYKGRYQASTAGRVRSLDRVVKFHAYTNYRGVYVSSYSRNFKGKIIIGNPTTSGHLRLRLAGKGRSVHKLVMLTFVGPPPIERQVLHENHNPADNRLTNLSYGTQSENIKADFEVGTRVQLEVVGTSILTGVQIRFVSQAAATRMLSRNGGRTGAIQHCLAGRALSAYGYFWAYA